MAKLSLLKRALHPRRAPGRRRSGGFTIVETMFAIGVLSIGVLGSGAALSSTLQLNRESRESIVAARDLEAAVEMVRGTTYGTGSSLVTKYPSTSGGPASGAHPLAAFCSLHLKGEFMTLGWYYYDSSYNEVALPVTSAGLPNWPAANGNFPATLQFRINVHWSSASAANQTTGLTTNGTQNNQCVSGVVTSSG